MVCMGNICRSPMAQVVAQTLAQEAARSGRSGMASPAFDSAGTHAHHIGERPDPRATAALARRGYKIGTIRSRRITEHDFQRYDLILAMDRNNLASLQRRCPPAHLTKLRLFLEFAEGVTETEVPDPYYGGADGFDRVLDLCEAGARGLVKSLMPGA